MTPRATCMPTGVLYSWQGHPCWKGQRVETTQRVTFWSSRLGGGDGRRNTNRGCHCWGCNDTLWTKPAGHPKANRPHHQLLECEDHGRGNKGRASTCSYGDERVWDWSARDKWGQARTHTLHLGKRVLIRRREEDHNYLEKDWREKAKHSRVEEMGSSQSTCMRQKVLVRQHYACTY